jgi:lipopolysaccharide transport system permease protein
LPALLNAGSVEEAVYDSDPQLAHPGRFFRRLRSDLTGSFWLTRQLLRQNIRTRYSTSALGYLWLLAAPLATAAVWLFLHRARIVSVGETSSSYPVHLIAGLFLWTAFLRMLNAPFQQINASRHVLSRVSFPWEAMVLASWLEAMLEFGVFLVVLGSIMAVYGHNVLLIIPALPFCLLLMMLGGAGGLAIASLGILFDDAPRAASIATYGLFFLTPVIYPAPETYPAALTVIANPVGSLLVAARDVMTGVPLTHPTAVLGWSIATIVLFLFSAIVFRVSVPHLLSKL